MTSSYENPLQRQKRVRLERTVSLKFKNLEGFVTELSENISLGGMFLRTEDPQPVGALFDFELTLEEEGPLIQGIAEVMWVRENDDGPERLSGMGVRFLELAPGSRALIYQVVDQHIVRGGEPYDLHEPSPRERATIGGADAATVDEPTAGAEQESRARTVRAGSYAVLASPQRSLNDERGPRETWRRTRRAPSRRVVGLGAAVLAVLVLAALGWALWPGSGDEPAAPTLDGETRVADASPGRDPLETVVPAGPIPELADPGRSESEASQPEDLGPEGSEPGEVEPKEEATTARPADIPAPEPPRETSPEPPRSADPAPAAATPTAEPAAATPGRSTATMLRDISWQRQGGSLVVTLTADGPWTNGGWDHFRMDEGTPREVVRLRGIREPFRPGLPVGETELRQIRTGYHRRAGGPELHVVLDLSSPRVRLTGMEAQGADLRITLEYP